MARTAAGSARGMATSTSSGRSSRDDLRQQVPALPSTVTPWIRCPSLPGSSSMKPIGWESSRALHVAHDHLTGIAGAVNQHRFPGRGCAAAPDRIRARSAASRPS